MPSANITSDDRFLAMQLEAETGIDHCEFLEALKLKIPISSNWSPAFTENRPNHVASMENFKWVITEYLKISDWKRIPNDLESAIHRYIEEAISPSELFWLDRKISPVLLGKETYKNFSERWEECVIFYANQARKVEELVAIYYESPRASVGKRYVLYRMMELRRAENC